VVRLPTLNGDNPFAPIRMLDYRKVFSEGNYWERFYHSRHPASPLIDAGNVGFLLHMGDVDVGRLQQSGWDPIPWELPFPMFVFRNREAMPRYYLVSHVRRAGTAAEARELLQTADPRREAIVEGAPAWHGAPEKALPAVKVISYRPDRVELQTTAPDTAYLVIAESWAPGWEAWVDGRRAGLYPTNLAFQGLPLAAGEHRLTIAYVPTAAYAALGLSVLAWIGMAVWVWKPAASATAVVT